MAAKTNGWVAVGFNKVQAMVGTDAYVGWIAQVSLHHPD